jgi:Trk K+ transport system NAD-binding subunit
MQSYTIARPGADAHAYSIQRNYHLAMRIVIVGGGEVGFGLSQALAARHEVVIVDHAPKVADRFEKLDVDTVIGSGTSAEVLARAGIARAEVFVACTGLDEVNIVACGMANQLGAPQTMCFVSREDFLRMSGKQEGLELFGVNRVIWPEAQLAEDIERVVAIPGAIDAEEFAGGAVRLLEYRVDPGSPLVDQPRGPPVPTRLLDRRRAPRRHVFHPSRRHAAERRRQGRRHGHPGGDGGGAAPNHAWRRPGTPAGDDYWRRGRRAAASGATRSVAEHTASSDRARRGAR